jgi:hypothetical protein
MLGRKSLDEEFVGNPVIWSNSFCGKDKKENLTRILILPL